ncbi:Accessory secretory protein Asp2 [Fructilactobacillus florum 8D]|uniref:Accessory secretory protein Asp2 n=1 Tax=Fructilactobacillus florum 8D TaxID=1221538 RepID=W9EN12_9LACO|nr:accessory Sec system protein Asp2 [Fructilactobacillus florum]ETO41044.1 Accessory secretory protein Asp2 [Fructilactobacillus florum 8D]
MSLRKQQPTLVIHLTRYGFTDAANILGEDYQYYWSDDRRWQQEIIADQPLFDDAGKLNKAYQRALFIIDNGFPWLTDRRVIQQLPANQIFFAKQLKISSELHDLLSLRGAIEFNKLHPEKLFEMINYYWYSGSDGYRYDPQSWLFNPALVKTIYQRGNLYREFQVTDQENWDVLTYPNHSFYLPARLTDTISLDYQVFSGVQLGLKIKQIDVETGYPLQTIFLTKNEDLNSFEIKGPRKRATQFQVLLYIRGSGQVRIGELHVRRSRGAYGNMMINDQMLTDQQLHGNIGIYFNAGDLKPPLNVYFAGYRTKEGYEGNRMMASMGAPYLLISDWRLEGGAFYLGDPAFEHQLVSIIKKTLQRLQFEPQQLILSGMSMGTFGALYYGAQLNPSGIVVGKPLTQLGEIAQNGRVKRSTDFRTAEDIQLYYEPDLTEASSQHLNDRFWNVFRAGKLTQTTLAVAYMLQDDYDQTAFQRLRQAYWQLNPAGRLLAKGFVGRHNDDTAGVVQWFQRQYRFLLQEFGRD